MTSWDALRRQARTLESEIDAKLVSYSKLGTTMALNASRAGTEVPSTMGGEIQRMLASLTEINELMRAHVSESGQTAALMHTLQRHRDILHDYNNEFGKTRRNIEQHLANAELMSGVRRDIDKNNESARAEFLMRERNALHGADSAADQVIGTAASARLMLGQQRSTFDSISTRMAGMGQNIPIIGGLIQSADRRRKRDSLILGTVVGTLACILIYYVFSRP